jgi:glycosyltransferase involved in cell wall biosynthesis
MTVPGKSNGPLGGGRARTEGTPPSISVIIPTHDRHQYAVDAARSIVRQTGLAPDSYEILIVENAPIARLEARIDAMNADSSTTLRHVHERNAGLHQARHAGARAASGQLLVYVDDDVLAPPTWLAALIAGFDDPEVAIAGGPIRPRWEGELPSWLSDFPESYFSLLDAGSERRELSYPDGAYGCNMAIRRQILFDVGGFNPDAMGWDERLFWLRGDGETGLHRRVHDAGHRVVYLPDAGLEHRMPASRLTPQAMRRRGLMVGLSHSFSDIRSTSREKSFRLRLFARANRALGSALRCGAAAIKHPQRRVFITSEMWRHLGYARQHLLAALHPRSLRYILRESYLSDAGP